MYISTYSLGFWPSIPRWVLKQLQQIQSPSNSLSDENVLCLLEWFKVLHLWKLAGEDRGPCHLFSNSPTLVHYLACPWQDDACLVLTLRMQVMSISVVGERNEESGADVPGTSCGLFHLSTFRTFFSIFHRRNTLAHTLLMHFLQHWRELKGFGTKTGSKGGADVPESVAASLSGADVSVPREVMISRLSDMKAAFSIIPLPQ